ncbi:hypothetical protein R3P38DRAFT_587439 [Favolaschia claudopus]|uniref:Uncharacterized protein n=1 Tax=Favolaschia claudopus TaxID=2862362 RepID=A0AAW0CD52_9AGAR
MPPMPSRLSEKRKEISCKLGRLLCGCCIAGIRICCSASPCSVDISGGKRKQMEYKAWDRLVALPLGIGYKGWPKGIPFDNPSSLKGTAFVNELWIAVMGGSVLFYRLSTTEHEAAQAKFKEQKITHGKRRQFVTSQSASTLVL